jgi:hypothetical protein
VCEEKEIKNYKMVMKNRNIIRKTLKRAAGDHGEHKRKRQQII